MTKAKKPVQKAVLYEIRVYATFREQAVEMVNAIRKETLHNVYCDLIETTDGEVTHRVPAILG